MPVLKPNKSIKLATKKLLKKRMNLLANSLITPTHGLVMVVGATDLVVAGEVVVVTDLVENIMGKAFLASLPLSHTPLISAVITLIPLFIITHTITLVESTLLTILLVDVPVRNVVKRKSSDARKGAVALRLFMPAPSPREKLHLINCTLQRKLWLRRVRKKKIRR